MHTINSRDAALLLLLHLLGPFISDANFELRPAQIKNTHTNTKWFEYTLKYLPSVLVHLGEGGGESIQQIYTQ